MIEEIKLKNTGSEYKLSYVDEVGEILVPQIPQVISDNIVVLTVYVEDLKARESARVAEIMDELEQKEIEKQELISEKNKLTGYLIGNELPVEVMLELIDIYPAWDGNSVEYEKDQKIRHNGILYNVVKKHTSQLDWIPDDSTLSLYSPIAPPEVIAEWVQPLGAHDAYNTGDKVTFNGEIYECLQDAVTHSPTVYPAGWKKI